MDRIDEIRAREQAATPGPWHVAEGKSFGVQSENKNIASCFRDENERFIAHAREDIPYLLAEVDRLTRERDAAVKIIRDARVYLEELGSPQYCLYQLMKWPCAENG